MTRTRKLSTALAAVLALGIGMPKGSAQTKYTRKGGAKVDVKVKQTNLSRGLKENTKKGKSEFVPEISADEFVNVQGKVKHIRAQQIAEFRGLINDTDPNDPELPDLLFRLAEQYAQQQRYWRFRAGDMFGKIDKAKTKSAKAALKRKQASYQKEEKKYLTEAIKIYAVIANTAKFKNFSRMDEALFYYAYTLQGAKRVDLARKVYQQLIQDYPNSKFVPFAYLSFADYFFEQNNLAQAEKFYDKVLQFPKSPIYPYAMYKKGWVYLNLDRHQDALETFFTVAQKTDNQKKFTVLNKAAKKDFVRAYAEVGRAEKAYQAFQRVDKGYSFNMLKILATIYLDQGKAEKTIYTHRELIGLRPKDSAVCEWQFNIVQATIAAGNNEQKVEQIENLVKLYLKYGGKSIKGSALEECRENAEGLTYEMGALWHQEVMKTLNFETLAHVEKLYEIFLKAFPKSKRHAEVQYYFAESLWLRAENEKNARLATERWEKAAVAFTDVVSQGKLGPKQKKEAAYAAVLGWKNALAVDPRTSTPTTEMDEKGNDKPPEPRPISEREQKMITAFDIYIKYIKDPEDDELVMMKFLKARIYWTHDHLEEALPVFQDILTNHEKHETAGYSAAIIRDSLIRLQKYEELGTYVTAMLEKEAFWEDREELQEIFKKDKAVVQRKVAEKYEKGGQHLKCGLAYLEIYEANKESDQMDEVLYNAGVCFEDAKSIGLAIRMYEILSAKFAKSEHTQKALVRMGNAYGAIAWYDRASEKYEIFAKKYGGEKDAAGALQNAVTYRKGLGDDKEAIANIEYFVKTFKRKKATEAADALFGLAGIYEKQGDEDKEIKAYTRYLREMGSKGGRDRVVWAHARIGQILWEESCKGRGVDGACVKIDRERAVRRRGKRRRSNVLPDRCGEDSRIKLTVLRRDDRTAKKAQGHFKSAIKEYQKGNVSDDPGRAAVATYWYAASRFYLAEEQFESFLSVKFPTKLDFSERNAKKKADSEKRFLKFMGEKEKMGGKANEMYMGVREITGGGAAWAIAAAARIGQISQNAADALYSAEVPKDLRTGKWAQDSWDAYCDALTSAAAPLEERSLAGFSKCLDTSTALNWFSTWSKLCERELSQIRPLDFPSASELHGEPNQVSDITDTQGLETKIKAE